MSITIVPGAQTAPAHYFNRRFANEYNLPALGRAVKTGNKFPATTKEASLALAALSLNRLLVALRGQAQANNSVIAGSVAAWATEVTDARAQAELALSAVAAACPTFRTAEYVAGQLNEIEAQDKGRAAYPAPSQLDADWFTGNLLDNAAPTANNVTRTVANNTAISFNFLTAASAADVDSDVLRIAEINGTTIDYDNPAATHVFAVNGKQFTFTKATQVLSANAQANPNTWTGTFKVKDDEGGLSALRTWSVENLPA